MHRMMWHRGYGYRRGGFFPWPGLLLLVLFALVFGKFLWPLLFLMFFIAPFIFWSRRGYWGWHGGWEHEKRKWQDYDEEKPKRVSDDESVTIV